MDWSIGRNERVAFVVEQSKALFGTVPGDASTDPFAAADAVRVINFKANRRETRERREDENASRTNEAETPLRVEADWEMEGYLLHSGTASGAPDMHEILEQAFGTQAVTATSVDFSPATIIEKSLCILHPDKVNKNFSKLVLGAVVEELEITGDGSSRIKWKANGPAKDVCVVSRFTIPGGASAGETILTPNYIDGIMPNTLVIASGGSEMMRVDSVDEDAGTITVTRGYGASSAGSIASGTAFVPWFPSTETFAATNPLAGVGGSITMSGVTMHFNGFTYKLKNNHVTVNDEYGTNSASGFESSGNREVTLTLRGHIERDELRQLIGAGYHRKQKTYVVNIGTNTEYKITLIGDADLPPWDTSDPGRLPVELTVRGRHSTANAETLFQHT